HRPVRPQKARRNPRRSRRTVAGPDRGRMARPAAVRGGVGTMTHHVVTLHSNPCRYKRPEANYWTFREALPASVTLHTIEISYDGEFRIPDAHHVAAGPQHLLWQKEAALRWMIRNIVPAAADVVSWCDADVL